MNDSDPLAGRAPHPSSSLAERMEEWADARDYEDETDRLLEHAPARGLGGQQRTGWLREAAAALRASSESTPPGSEKRPGETEKRCGATPTFGSDLTFFALRAANTQRQSEWDRDDKITLSYRGNELAGEVGEACNVLKKIERERLGIRGSRDTVEHLAEELADVVICVDLVAQHEGIDLGQAVCAKFNATSEKQGLKTRLTAPSEDAEPAQDERECPDCGIVGGGHIIPCGRNKANERAALIAAIVDAYTEHGGVPERMAEFLLKRGFGRGVRSRSESTDARRVATPGFAEADGPRPSDLTKETERANRNYIEYERAKDVLARTLWSPDVCRIVQRFIGGAPRSDDFARLVAIIRPEVPLAEKRAEIPTGATGEPVTARLETDDSIYDGNRHFDAATAPFPRSPGDA